MAIPGCGDFHSDAKLVVHMLGVALCSLLLASCASAEPPAASRATSATRQRRSDDYDNMDNFLMGAGDYDNFFLKTAKSVPRIGRRSEGRADDQTPLHVDRRSTDANELVPSYAHGADHFFLKASKSVPRIGKRNDEFFMKTAKSVPRIGRRSGEDADDAARVAELQPIQSELLLNAFKSHQIERRSRAQVEEGEWPAHSSPGGNDAVLGRQHVHRIQRRNYDELMAKAAKTVPRMGKRMHPALDEVGDWGSEQQWPWFRQQDPSPGPYKRANPADLIDLREVPWGSLDLMLRELEARSDRSGRPGRAGGADLRDDDKHDVVLLAGELADDLGDKWAYSAVEKKAERAERAAGGGSKELEEARFQPDARKRK